jgi:hypothetical protein
MRRTLLVLCLVVSLVMLLAPVALAQESQGANSERRNETAFHGGPHCHINLVASANQDDVIAVFPSHKAHAQTGLADGIFAATDC